MFQRPVYKLTRYTMTYCFRRYLLYLCLLSLTQGCFEIDVFTHRPGIRQQTLGDTICIFTYTCIIVIGPLIEDFLLFILFGPIFIQMRH